MKKIIKNPRKGVSLVELIVALSIISIITVAAITMMNTAVKVEVKAASVIEANNSLESIIEIFRFSNDETEFDIVCNEFFEDAIIIKLYESRDDESYIKYSVDKGRYVLYLYYYYTAKDEKNIGYKIKVDARHSNLAPIFNDKLYIKG